MSETGLQAGDIVFTAYKSDFSSTNGKYFEFVLLESVPAGTQIYFTDSGFRTDTGSFRTNEDILRWTAQADLPAGTRITFQQEPDGANNASGEWANVSYFGFESNVAGLALNNSGDQIHAFIDPQFSTAQYDSLFATPVASINAAATYSASYDLTGAASQTGLPTGLTVGSTALLLGDFDNGKYTGSIDATPDEIRAAINNPANWTRSNNPLTTSGSDAVIDPINEAPTSSNLGGDAALYMVGSDYVAGDNVALDVGGNATILDEDSTDLAGGTLTVSIAESPASLEDGFGFDQSGAVSVVGSALFVNGLQIGTFTGGTGGSDLVVSLESIATPALVQEAVRAITYRNLSGDPTYGDRTISITLVDGDGTFDGGTDTMSLTTTVTVAELNEEPFGADKDAALDEDDAYIFALADFPIGDGNGNNLLGVTIVTVPGNGTLQLDGVTLTNGNDNFVSTADIAAGRLIYVPDLDGNGSPFDTFTFAVRDDGGTLGGGIDQDQSPNTFTLNVSAVNDAPTLTGSALPAFVTEAGNAASSGETGRVNLFTGVTIADIDAISADQITGAVVRISDDFQTGSTHQDFLRINGNASGTIAGSGIDYAYDSTTGAMVLTGAATIAEYKAAIELVQFSTSGDNVTAFGAATTRQVAVSVSDGLATSNEIFATVTVTGVNDAPVNSGAAPVGAGFVEDATNIPLTGFSVSDVDADPATQDIQVTFMITHGTLDIRTDVAGGITAAMITGGADNSDSITVTATQNQINATLGNATGLTFTPPANFNGNPSFAIISNDLGLNGNDPGMTGAGTSEEDADGWVVNIAAVDDPAVAQPDALSTDEATLNSGSLFADHGSGPDVDIDGPPTVSAVNGSAANVGTQITLASGALLTVNADGSYSYDPNDEFNHLVAAETGAVNTTAVDTFTYTLAGGNTVTVTVTIAGITNVGDVIAGGPGNDNLLGTESKDVFVGYGGADTMTGFGGKDVYHVDSLDDQVIEAVDGGRDQVRTNLSTYTLPDNVEAILGRAGDQVLTGNALDNIMEGGAGADVMIGLAGNDLYSVDNVGDMVVEAFNEGRDTVGSVVSFTLGANVEDLALNGVGEIDGTGNELANRITGNGANNVLDGKAGADKLAGGVGDDTYVVDNADDRVTEFAGQGTDSIVSSVDYILAAGVENLTLSGAAVAGTGNALNNILIGTDGFNGLSGGAGADVIHGRGGNDKLTGGLGADQFVFDTALDALNNVDKIRDFSSEDTIMLFDDVFGAIASGELAAGAFHNGMAATSADHRIIYNQATGSIFYDADGVGGASQIAFASVVVGTVLSNTDFWGFGS